MKRVVILGIILHATTQGMASSVDAFKRYHEAEQNARKALVSELNVAIRKARGLDKTERAASIQMLKEKAVAGDRIPLEFPELREKLAGSVWSLSKTIDWDQNGTPVRFTKSEVFVGTGENRTRDVFETVGPRLLRFSEGLVILDRDLNRCLFTNKISSDFFNFHPAIRLQDVPKSSDTAEPNGLIPPPEDGYFNSTKAKQALLTYDFSVKRARKHLLKDLRSVQRNALDARELNDAVSLQTLRERITAGRPVPRSDPDVRRELNGSVWACGNRWENGTIRLSFDLEKASYKDSRGLKIQDYAILDYRTIRYGQVTIYFDKGFTRLLIVSDSFEFRTAKRLK